MGGNVLRLRGSGLGRPVNAEDEPVRGRIVGFSPRSRNRLLEAFAEIDEAAGLPVFVTATVGRDWSKNPADWCRWLDGFRKALERRFPGVWGAWRKDFQPNRPDHAVHFHFLLWGLPELETVTNRKGERVGKYGSEKNRELYGWFAETWARIAAGGDPDVVKAGTRVEVVRSQRGVMFYASKYMAKLDGALIPVDHPGRMWGRIGSKRWQVDKVEIDLTKEEFNKARRVLRKYLGRKTGRKYRTRPGAGIMAFLPSRWGLRLLLWAKGVPDAALA